MITRIIHGEFAPYYSQRNNVHFPGTTCGITSAINAMAALNIPFPRGIGQPEDRLYEFITHDEECLRLYKKKKSPIPMHEWQDILALGINRWTKTDRADFDEFASTQKILDYLMIGGLSLVTGDFPGPNNKILSHTVALIGVEFEGNCIAENVKKYWIRDPWGDHRTLYRIVKGKTIELTPQEFQGILKKKNEDRKWAIIIHKN